jgi:ABC-2 type transport system ATP-binding protein
VDPIARRSFWDLIYQLSEAGHTIFVTTHYMDEAEYCHRLALMYRGRVIALGAPEQLKDELQSHVLMRLETNDVLETMRALESVEGLGDVAVFGSGLHVTVASEGAAGRIREALQTSGIEVRLLERIQPSMEDVFVAMIASEEQRAA